MSTNIDSPKRVGNFPDWAKIEAIATMVMANFLGILVAFMIPALVLYGQELQDLGYNDARLIGGVYVVTDISLNNKGTYEIEATERVTLTAYSCVAPFEIGGVASVAGSREQRLGRCNSSQPVIYVLTTDIKSGNFMVTPGLSVRNSRVKSELKSPAFFRLKYVPPPWGFAVWVFIILWILCVIPTAYILNRGLWKAVGDRSELQRINKRRELK